MVTTCCPRRVADVAENEGLSWGGWASRVRAGWSVASRWGGGTGKSVVDVDVGPELEALLAPRWRAGQPARKQARAERDPERARESRAGRTKVGMGVGKGRKRGGSAEG